MPPPNHSHGLAPVPLAPVAVETPAAATRADARFFLAVVGGAGWLVGIGVASAVDAGPGFWLLMAAAALVGAATLWRVGRVGLLLAGVAALALGGARLAAAQPHFDAGALAFYNGHAGVEVRGEVIAEPERSDTSLRLRVAARELVLDGQTRPVAGIVYVQTHRYPAVDYGATVSLRGDLDSPDVLGSADFAAYLEQQGVYSVMEYQDVTVLATDGGSPVIRALLAIRARGRATLAAILPEPQASLLTGILLGDDSGLPRATGDAFKATGMTHLIAISGFNIALIVALLDRLIAPLLPRRTGALVIIVFLVFYTVLVGAAPSVVRAAIMGSAYLIGLRLLGRPTWALAGLFVAAFLMTLLNPNALWHLGFQLSFAATLGLLLYATPWSRQVDRGAEALLSPALARPVRQLLREGVVVTLAAQVLVVPLLLYQFGRLSLASLPANLLVLPAQPAVMASGGVALGAGLLLPAAGRIVAAPAWLFLTYTLAVIDRLAAQPWASVPLELSGRGVVAVYAAIGALTLLAMRDRDTGRTLAARLRLRPVPLAALGGAAVVVVLAVAWWTARPDGRLHVAFLDVGQGDAIFIQSPGGAQVLIDGGRYPSVLLDRLGEQMPFWDHSLDLVIATHPDDDHVAGLPEVVARYDVAQVITNGATADDAPAYAALLAGAAAVHVAAPGERIDLGDGARLDILSAGGADGAAGRNDASIVARLTYGQLSVLLTGDAESGTEEALLAGGQPLASVVLKAGHHGANTSSSEAFLRAVAPQVIVISVGADNTYGHPAPAMLARAAAVGATVLRTDKVGTVEVSSDGERMWWVVER